VVLVLATRRVLAHLVRAWRKGTSSGEPCGALFGTAEDACVRLVEAHDLANVHPAPARAFTIAPEDLLAAQRAARERRLEVVALWHGHLLGPPTPSRDDERSYAGPAGTRALPAILVLVGRGVGASPVVRAWQMGRGSPREFPLKVAHRSGGGTRTADSAAT